MKFFSRIVLCFIVSFGMGGLSAAASSYSDAFDKLEKDFFNFDYFDKRLGFYCDGSDDYALEHFLFESMLGAVNSDCPEAVLYVVRAYNTVFKDYKMLIRFYVHGINFVDYSRIRYRGLRRMRLSEIPRCDQFRRQGACDVYMVLKSQMNLGFMWAVDRLDVESVRSFLEFGAKPEIGIYFGNKKISAMKHLRNKIKKNKLYARCKSDLEAEGIVCGLMQDVIDKSLFVAVRSGNLDWVKRLISAGANPTRLMGNDKNAYELAVDLSNQHYDTLTFKLILASIRRSVGLNHEQVGNALEAQGDEDLASEESDFIVDLQSTGDQEFGSFGEHELVDLPQDQEFIEGEEAALVDRLFKASFDSFQPLDEIWCPQDCMRGLAFVNLPADSFEQSPASEAPAPAPITPDDSVSVVNPEPQPAPASTAAMKKKKNKKKSKGLRSGTVDITDEEMATHFAAMNLNHKKQHRP